MPSQGSTAARGYGKAHEQQRRAWEPRVRRGEANCWRCRQPIPPDGPWDLGHSDDRTKWMGPECVGCNRRAGAAKANAARQGLRHSRPW